jgi:hypothetical protein
MVAEAGLAELGLWAALNASSPLGAYREDLRNAQLCALIGNINRNPEKRPQPFRLRDFLLFPRAGEAPAAEASVETRVKAALVSFAGGLKGAALKVWRSARRQRVGKPR